VPDINTSGLEDTIPNRHLHPTVAKEVVPTKDQIIAFLRNAKPSSQVIIALIAFLGGGSMRLGSKDF